MKWINQEDELPEQEVPVLIYIMCSGRKQILMGAYSEDEHGKVWYDYQTEDDFEDKPLFWQHLPEEPKEDLLSIHSVVNSNCDKKPKKCKHKYGLFTHINNGQNLMFKCKKCKRDMTYEQLQIERKERK